MADDKVELEFTGEVASWINVLLSHDSDLPFLEAKIEQRAAGSQKRRDLTLLGKDKRILLTGEVKLPYRADGGSPYNEKVVQDARGKAARAQSKYFFTWNVNQFVLWETFPPESVIGERNYRSWKVTFITKESQLSHPDYIGEIKDWLPVFLHDFTRILLGASAIGLRAPDEKFIEALEAALQLPVSLTLESLSSKYKEKSFKSQLDKWMREDQGWVIYDDPEGVRDNLERAAKFACYALVNKLVFHEALLKRYGAKLSKLNVPNHIDSGDGLRLHLESYFGSARKITGDYETVFGEDRDDMGARIPFYSDLSVAHWRELISQVHHFDFSRLDYEVIGRIFERLISPEERHKYGQFYTRPEVVDLINSFCIWRGDEKVMDPACGGGTFLVRAYSRKKHLMPERAHGELLRDLFGVDISHFAAHLSTINLATRDLIDEENYPQIARCDFFDVGHGKPFLFLPKHERAASLHSRGMGKIQQREVSIPSLDAIVGNPPYVRQEDIRKSAAKGAKAAHGTKEYYSYLLTTEWKDLKLGGRSDLHCYFWPHAATFLKDDGYLCLLTSSQWLDVEYGFKLQEWILNNFKIIAVLESQDEPWFVGARVVTTATILQREKNAFRRDDNTVRFVRLNRPLAEVLANDGTTGGAISAASGFRDELLTLYDNVSAESYNARLVRQRILCDEGVKLGRLLSKDGEKVQDEDGVGKAEYAGGKWGIHLRAPDLWFALLDDVGKRLVPLAEIANIKRGVTTGKDDYFFPIDVSDEKLAECKDDDEFEQRFGVNRGSVKNGKVRLVNCGEGRGEVKAIEAEYLEPEVHSLMEIGGFTVEREDCRRLILLVGEKKAALKGKHVLDYIRWGERNGWHKGSTCAARASEGREWYDLTGHERGTLFWPMAQQYKHVVPLNEHNLLCNHNLFDLVAPGLPSALLAGLLNSTWVLLSKYQYGRPVGVEGNLKTEVIDTKLMLVPDPREAKETQKQKVIKAFEKMSARKALPLLSERRLRKMAYLASGRGEDLAALSGQCELDMPDRRTLDDAVLQILGVASPKRRTEMLDALYDYLREFFERTRQKEEKAIENKKRSKRRGPARPSEIAAQILEEVKDSEPQWLKSYPEDFLPRDCAFDVYDLPSNGVPQRYSDLYVAHAVSFGKSRGKSQVIEVRNWEQAALVILLAAEGIRGLVRIPHEAMETKSIHQEFAKFATSRYERLKELAAERTADEEMQAKVLAVMLSIIHGQG